MLSVVSRRLPATLLLFALLATAAAAQAPDLAARFGAREAVVDMSISPDGTRVAYLVPAKGQGTALRSVALTEGAAPETVFAVDGNPQQLRDCTFVSAERLVCTVQWTTLVLAQHRNFSRVVALDRSGGNPRILSAKQSSAALGLETYGGAVIDWLPDAKDGNVLMERVRVAEETTGRLTAKSEGGLSVERVDTATLKSSMVERPAPTAVEHITDGHGVVRIRALHDSEGDGYSTGLRRYFFRLPDSREWRRLSIRDYMKDEGFDPYAVDRELNVAYGFDKHNGRQALFKVKLDGSDQRTLVLAHPEVDVDGLVRLGRHRRVVGATYATDTRQVDYFDPVIAKLRASLDKALPDDEQISIFDASLDEQKLLIFAGSDDRPGTFYVLDRQAKSMRPLLAIRPQLEGLSLAQVKPVRYPAADGTMVPGYLTLPPGKPAKGLPAIVLPHGGPSARDEWGFDWLSQYYAAMGYAVLQPNFRGSAGYGDAWLRENGFKSWKIAVGDVADAGRWLVKEGIADAKKLGIVGWSYGGYAALLAPVVAPGLFRSVVAIAPVTDLTKLKDQYRQTSARTTAFDFIGAGPHIEEGSPAKRAREIKAPVLLFHGARDTNVDIGHSTFMAERLKAAGVPHRLVTWDHLDHYLVDSEARATMLRDSEAHLRANFGS
jgi:dipeptidyl aminopeptidase/acylaminoacyl peptidase